MPSYDVIEKECEFSFHMIGLYCLCFYAWHSTDLNRFYNNYSLLYVKRYAMELGCLVIFLYTLTLQILQFLDILYFTFFRQCSTLD